MKLKKILAAVAATAVAVSTMAITAFAATVEMNSDYAGAWAQTATIPKSEFEAIGGDVKVVLTVEMVEPLGTHNHLAKPMDANVSWDAITDGMLSDTQVAKEDGFFVFKDGQTTFEFVVPESVWSAFADNTDNPELSGLSFQANDVTIKSAELSAADSTPGKIKRVSEEDSGKIMDGSLDPFAASGDSAPAGDGATDSAKTGNVPAAAMVSVMALAGVAAIAAKKRK